LMASREFYNQWIFFAALDEDIIKKYSKQFGIELNLETFNTLLAILQ
jgi:hypothetical protein